jgi:ribosomal protein S15P/S13E
MIKKIDKSKTGFLRRYKKSERDFFCTLTDKVNDIITKLIGTEEDIESLKNSIEKLKEHMPQKEDFVNDGGCNTEFNK